MSADQIAALLHERERHELAGRTERVAAIDQELAALSPPETAQDTTPVEKAVHPRPARRK